ncbi:MAG: hypothetical protein PHV37_09510 [Candidatus Gastranaerophilales bacterium]|nr:hypothetical protein [Candidatus Gastranaerophilales bacterium]
MISKIQLTQNHYANKNNNASFKGLEGAVTALRFLDNSPAIGACAVDLGSMVIPRTAIDMKNRGFDAGTETAFREGTSTANNALVGVEGALAAAAVSGAINTKYGVQAHKIFANNDAIDLFSNVWQEAKGDKKEYFKGVLNRLQGLDGNEWKSFKPLEKAETSIESLAEELSTKPLTKELKQKISNIIVQNTGARSNFKVASNGKSISNSIDVIIENAASLGESFASKKINDMPQFVKDLKKVKTSSALLGLAIPVAIGISTQPINKYITKKRTGNDGFVGVDGKKEADKSTSFKVKKGLMAALMGAVALGSITTKPSELLGKLQFTSKIPNLNQFKLIYGTTIMSRLLASRDKNELRESSIKDFLGFTNWLILGGIVTKLTARALPKGKELINYVDTGKKGIAKAWDWVSKASVKNYDEVLLKNSKNVVDNAGKALSFNNLLKTADKVTKSKVGKLALAQVLGYAYSGIVLGVGIAKLNIFITKQVQKKKDTSSPQQQPLVKNDANVIYFAQKAEKASEVFSEMQK